MKRAKKVAAPKKVRRKTAVAKTRARSKKPNGRSAQLRTMAEAGGVHLVDLTQTLSPDFPPIVLPPEMGQSRPWPDAKSPAT